MINKLYYELDDALKDEFRSVFSQKDEEKIFNFFRKYMKFVESDEHSFNRLFLTKNPLHNTENKEFMEEFNSTCLNYLNKTLYTDVYVRNSKFIRGNAAVYMGFSYEYGLLGIAQNHHKAFDFYTIATQLYSDIGTFRLAQCFERKIGTAQNNAKALYFYRCAAKLGLPDAMHAYGSILINGYLGCKKDIDTGLHFLQLAAASSNSIYPYSLFDLGKCYESKTQIEIINPDDEYAFKVFEAGARKNDPNCQHLVASAYAYGEISQRRDIAKSIEWYRKAAENGQIDAQIIMSNYYSVGVSNIISRNKMLTCYWALRAASKGNGKAAYILSEYASEGKENERDILSSWWWIEISESMGYQAAKSRKQEILAKVNAIDEGPQIPSTCCSLFCW